MSKTGTDLNRIINSTITEWPDVVALLQRVIKCIAKNEAIEKIEKPILLKLFKKCHLFMNPKLPAGVHAKVMELYKTMWPLFTDIEKQMYLQFMVLSLQSFGLISMKMKAVMIEVFEMFLQIYVGSSAMPLIASILPGIEEEQSETFVPCMKVLELLTTNVTESTFYTSMWHILINYQDCRIPGLMYLIKKLPNPIDKEDLVFLFSNDQHIISCAFESCFSDSDPTGLIQRNALDVLLFMDPLLFDSINLKRLITAAIKTCLKRDMSLNKRLFQFICPNESHYERIEPILIVILKEALKTDHNHAFRILISLLDKPLVLKTICDMLPYIVDHSSKEDHNSSAQQFIDCIPRHLLFNGLYFYLKDVKNCLNFLNFVSKYQFTSTKDHTYYIPLLLLNIIKIIAIEHVPVVFELLTLSEFAIESNEWTSNDMHPDLLLIDKPQSNPSLSLLKQLVLQQIKTKINAQQWITFQPIATVFIGLCKHVFQSPIGEQEEPQIESNDPIYASFLLLFRYFQHFKVKDLLLCMKRINIVWKSYEEQQDLISVKRIDITKSFCISQIDHHIKLLDTFFSQLILHHQDVPVFLHLLQLLLDTSHNFYLPRTFCSLLHIYKNKLCPQSLFLNLLDSFHSNTNSLQLFKSLFGTFIFNKNSRNIGPITFDVYICHSIVNTTQLGFVVDLFNFFLQSLNSHLFDICFNSNSFPILIDTIHMICKLLLIDYSKSSINIAKTNKMEYKCISLLSTLLDLVIQPKMDDLLDLVLYLHEFSINKFHSIAFSMQTFTTMHFVSLFVKIDKLNRIAGGMTSNSTSRVIPSVPSTIISSLLTIYHNCVLNPRTAISSQDLIMITQFAHKCKVSSSDTWPYFSYYTRLALQNCKNKDHETILCHLLVQLSNDVFLDLQQPHSELQFSTDVMVIPPDFIHVHGESFDAVSHLADTMVQFGYKPQYFHQILINCNPFILSAFLQCLEFHFNSNKSFKWLLSLDLEPSVIQKCCLTCLRQLKLTTNKKWHLILLYHWIPKIDYGYLQLDYLEITCELNEKCLILLIYHELKLEKENTLLDQLLQQIPQCKEPMIVNESINYLLDANSSQSLLFLINYLPNLCTASNYPIIEQHLLLYIKHPSLSPLILFILYKLALGAFNVLVIATIKKIMTEHEEWMVLHVLKETIEPIRFFCSINANNTQLTTTQPSTLFQNTAKTQMIKMARVIWLMNMDVVRAMEEPLIAHLTNNKQNMMECAKLMLILIYKGNLSYTLWQTIIYEIIDYLTEYLVYQVAQKTKQASKMDSKMSKYATLRSISSLGSKSIIKPSEQRDIEMNQCLKVLELCDCLNQREYECFRHVLYPRIGQEVEDEHHTSLLMDLLSILRTEQEEMGDYAALGDPSDSEDIEQVVNEFVLIGSMDLDRKNCITAINRLINATNYGISKERINSAIDIELLDTQ